MADASGATIPSTFKSIVPFIRRAEELDRDTTRPESKLIAYFCRQYAMELGIKLRENDASAEATEFLLGLMDRLEDEKSKLPAFTQEEGKEICEDFAREIFAKADDEDRAGRADKNTARTFYAAGTFFDILNQFGDISDEIVEKRRYCKYKAATILKAIKEGQVPTPGGPAAASIPDESDDVSDPTPAASQAPVAPQAPAVLPPSPPAAQSPPSTSFPSLTTSVSTFQDSAVSIPPMSSHTFNRPPSTSALVGSSYPPPPAAPATVPAPMPPMPSRSRAGPICQNEVNDAIECAKFAIAALKIKDVDLAVERLEMALRCIKQ